MTPTENNYWNTNMETYQTRYYDLNITGSSTHKPIIYMSMNAPRPIDSFCNSGSYDICRIYTSFNQRRYFMVARRNANSVTSLRFSGTCSAPPSKDAWIGYYYTYIAWAIDSDRRYYHHYGWNRAQSRLVASTPAYSYAPTPFGSNLYGYASGFTISVNLNGWTLYGSKREEGQYKGSQMELSLSGFTNLYGCGVTLGNRPLSLYYPFYC